MNLPLDGYRIKRVKLEVKKSFTRNHGPLGSNHSENVYSIDERASYTDENGERNLVIDVLSNGHRGHEDGTKWLYLVRLTEAELTPHLLESDNYTIPWIKSILRVE